MKIETIMVISDAREALRSLAIKEATQNQLCAAFLAWLLAGEDWLPHIIDAADRAAATRGAERTSRNVAILGFACDIEKLRDKYLSEFARQLEWCIGKPNFDTGGEPSGAVADPIIFAGIIVGTGRLLDGEFYKRVESWARGLLKDASSIAPENWRRQLLDSSAVRLGLAKTRQEQTDCPVWFAAALHRRGWTSSSENGVADVLKSAVTKTENVTDGFEAGLRLAAVEWAVSRAIDFDVAALTLKDVATILERIPTGFQRWVWEDKPRTRGGQPRRWHVNNEYHFQSLLYVVLKPVLPMLEEEQYLPATGTYQPRADLCVRALELAIEVKFWYRNKSVKDLTEEIAADVTLYLRPDSPYRQLIAVIWDDGARTEEHLELIRGVKGFTGMYGVVIVNRPSCMTETGETN